VKSNRDDLAAESIAPDELTHRWCIASKQLCQQTSNDYVTWRALDELTPWKNIASVHPTLTFSVAVSQRLFGYLGLFIPHPLTH
jgi:hypothetical protein